MRYGLALALPLVGMETPLDGAERKGVADRSKSDPHCDSMVPPTHATAYVPTVPCDTDGIRSRILHDEKPIQRPAAATVNHNDSETMATSRVVADVSRAGLLATRRRTVNVNNSATGIICILSQNDGLL